MNASTTGHRPSDVLQRVVVALAWSPRLPDRPEDVRNTWDLVVLGGAVVVLSMGAAVCRLLRRVGL